MSKVVYSQRWEWQTRLPFPSLTVYKIKKNLENVPRNLDDLKYRGTFFVAFIYYVVFSSNRFNEMYPDFESFLYIGYFYY